MPIKQLLLEDILAAEKLIIHKKVSDIIAICDKYADIFLERNPNISIKDFTEIYEVHSKYPGLLMISYLESSIENRGIIFKMIEEAEISIPRRFNSHYKQSSST